MGFYLPEAVRAPAHVRGSSDCLRGCRPPNCSARAQGCFVVMLPEIPRRTHRLHTACKLSTGQPGHDWEACPPSPWQPACAWFWLEPPLPTSKSVWCQVAHLHLVLQSWGLQQFIPKQFRQSVPQVLAPARRWRLHGWSLAADEVSRQALLPERPWHMFTAHCRPQALAATSGIPCSS